MPALLLSRLVTLLCLHRDCTCHGRNTGLWGHLEGCPQLRWWRRGDRAVLTDVMPLAEFVSLVQRAAAAELAARDGHPTLAGGLDPVTVSHGVVRRVVGALTDQHLV